MNYDSMIAQWRDSMVESLRGCIRIPSVYATEQDYPYGKELHRCLTYMLDLGREFGFETVNMDEHLGWCEYGQGDEMVAILCHLDVVPEGEGWTVPPYEGLVKDGKLFGRGAIDDKGPAVAALYALRAIKESGVSLKRRIRLIFGLNEETGSADMRYYRQHGGEIPVMGFTPDGAYPVINGEKGIASEGYARAIRQTGIIRLLEINGGSALNVVPASAYASLSCPDDVAEQILALAQENVTCTRTAGGVRIIAKGIEAHGSTPEAGENAIGRLMLFLQKLPLEGELAQVVDFFAGKFGMETDGKALGVSLEDALSGKLTMNLGIIQGDTEKLQIGLNYRYPVTCSFEQCGPHVKGAFEEAGFRQMASYHNAPLYMAKDSLLVSTLLNVYADYTGERAEPICIGGGTYAKAIPNIVAFGPVFPGDEVREHQPDEFIELSRLQDNANMIANAICALAGCSE